MFQPCKLTQVRATKWYISVEKKVLQSIREAYVKISRESDNKSKDTFGNVPVSEKAWHRATTMFRSALLV